MKKLILSVVVVMATVVFAEAAEVQNVTAKQRYPWNGLVDIVCTVTGINGTTNGIKFAVAAVSLNSGDTYKASDFWVMQNGTKIDSRMVHTNGNYRLLWDAQADLDSRIYSNMVVRVTCVEAKVQLWKDGPYWAETNIGAEKPEDYGYYFWWGDTVGYKRENDEWVASDGSSSNFSFSIDNTPTFDKSVNALKSEGWITADNVLAPEHDAAHVQWGGNWRMPMKQELDDLNSKCDWTWTTKNGVKGYEVRGKDDYNSSSIFLPCAGADSHSFIGVGRIGCYWSSVPDGHYSWELYFNWSDHYTTSSYGTRYFGQSVRPVQGFTE